jgi:hypothetical protein
VQKPYKQKLIRLFWWWLVIIPSISFLLTSLGLFIYAYWPRDLSSVSQFIIKSNIEYITLSAHGVNDSPASWSNELQQLMSSLPAKQLTDVIQQNYSIDWQQYSRNVFLCSVAGKKLGIEIGKHLAMQPSLKGIHAIGHSCGAFVVLGICEGAKSINSQLTVQTTYLDPVSVYSGVFWDYGIEHFGGCADFSDGYIDTRDTVPGSNQALPYVYTFDVTEQQTEKDVKYPPNAWPTRFYINAYRANHVPLLYKVDLAIREQLNKGESVLLNIPN